MELSSGRRIFPSGPLNAGPLFRDFATDYLDWYAHEYPHSCYRVEQIIRQWLIPRFGHDRLAGMNKRGVEQYKAERLIQAKAATVTEELHVLQAVLNRAVEWEVISSNLEADRVINARGRERRAGPGRCLLPASPTRVDPALPDRRAALSAIC